MPFDALETTNLGNNMAYDLAFLLMDLDHRVCRAATG